VAIFGSILNGTFVSSVAAPLAAAKPEIAQEIAQAHQLVQAAAAGQLPPGVTQAQVEGAKQLLAMPDITANELQKLLASTDAINSVGQVSPGLKEGILDSFVDAMQAVYHYAIPVMIVGFLFALLIKQLPMRNSSAMAERMKEARAEGLA